MNETTSLNSSTRSSTSSLSALGCIAGLVFFAVAVMVMFLISGWALAIGVSLLATGSSPGSVSGLPGVLSAAVYGIVHGMPWDAHVVMARRATGGSDYVMAVQLLPVLFCLVSMNDLVAGARRRAQQWRRRHPYGPSTGPGAVEVTESGWRAWADQAPTAVERDRRGRWVDSGAWVGGAAAAVAAGFVGSPAFNIDGAPMVGMFDVNGNPYGAVDIGFTTFDHESVDHGSADHGMFDHGSFDHGSFDHGSAGHGGFDHT
jgi:hypothetical protein